MSRFSTALPALLCGCLATPLALAHHSAAMFDHSSTVTIQGTIKTYEWTNPHVWIWVLVEDRNGGEPKLWGIETANLSMARRYGFTKDTFKAGDKVTMVINPLRDGRDGGNFRKATFEDGHVVEMTSGPPPADASEPLAAAPAS
ncbi:MAG: DUF6152 family protein [Steroidobacteraceae bacterium]